ncbi:bifunctional phosphoribosyl-AMP cyclohydrolase/phosphoribosyl-ATP diphosphatase HisIE [Psychroserpens sp. XS_ASV72]|uniref:bifunctional phosphoribosyl-AMP cyclohydrolase/phosphoribosyl-ATP diphosphatase HisIE n=1 Tax=Psychroserpens sp. XS_ASV72 TaxID=3241293 RepID=UPI003519BD02
MTVDFKKNNGLVPAIVQDSVTKKVLMLGYMNKEALDKTISTQQVTFYSRSKKRLWTKGETSGNTLTLEDIKLDCDNDSLLLQVKPQGPTCHNGSDTCWNENNIQTYGFLTKLESIIDERKNSEQNSNSYVNSLVSKGINAIAQKVGEEAVETIIEAKDSNDDLFLNESADLIFHLLILLKFKGFSIQNVVKVLHKRHESSN